MHDQALTGRRSGTAVRAGGRTAQSVRREATNNIELGRAQLVPATDRKR
jgi:hypothetical protein